MFPIYWQRKNTHKKTKIKTLDEYEVRSGVFCCSIQDTRFTGKWTLSFKLHLLLFTFRWNTDLNTNNISEVESSKGKKLTDRGSSFLYRRFFSDCAKVIAIVLEGWEAEVFLSFKKLPAWEKKGGKMAREEYIEDTVQSRNGFVCNIYLAVFRSVRFASQCMWGKSVPYVSGYLLWPYRWTSTNIG